MSQRTQSVRRILLPILGLLVASASLIGQDEKEPQRPACKTARCRTIKSFVKRNYCGESPFGNGPDDGCEIKPPRKRRAGIQVVADYHCEWNENKRMDECGQRGQPSSATRDTLSAELRRLGLPSGIKGRILFKVLHSTSEDWSVALADYSRIDPDTFELKLCQVIVLIDHDSHVQVLREVPFQKTEADASRIITWTPLDLADVDGDGYLEIVLEGDGYEDHWIEVVSLRDSVPQTVFSGLGYYL